MRTIKMQNDLGFPFMGIIPTQLTTANFNPFGYVISTPMSATGEDVPRRGANLGRLRCRSSFSWF